MLADWLKRVKNALFARQYAYRQTFKGPYADEVLLDLARFCRAHESTFNADPRKHAVAEGRREVWLRLQHHLKMSPDQLWALYSGRPAKED